MGTKKNDAESIAKRYFQVIEQYLDCSSSDKTAIKKSFYEEVIEGAERKPPKEIAEEAARRIFDYVFRDVPEITAVAMADLRGNHAFPH